MKLSKPNVDQLIPDGTPPDEALARTTHLGVGAHPDDLEIMALHGILECFGRQDRWFTGVTCTDGRGSSRTGVYADYSDEDMMHVRQEEQRAAARIGRYAGILQLMHTSADTKDANYTAMRDDLVEILKATRPDVVYTHNPADKHATHVGVLTSLMAALRALPPEQRPATVYGCEVWRDLDWLTDAHKVALDCSGHESLAAALIGVFDSQIAGGKRYDLASAGRRRANATYFDSHGADTADSVIFAVDLTPVVCDDNADLATYMATFLADFSNSVLGQIRALDRG